MSWLQAVLLGLLQGLTEFLPVSSTAHMAVAPQLLGFPDPGATFSAIAQTGPVIALILYFWKDISRYIRGLLRTKTPANLQRDDVDARLGWFTLLGSLPGFAFGAFLEKKIDHDFRNLYVIAVSLIVFAFVLFLAERMGRRNVEVEQMTFQQSQVIGWAQVLSLVPGASRSGVTISAGLFQGLTRESAARFSFLLSLPFITGAGVYKLYKAFKPSHAANAIATTPTLHDIAGPAILASIVAGVFAYVVVRWFLGYMKEHDTRGFVIYRIALGILLLILLGTHRLQSVTTKPEDTPTANASNASHSSR